MSVKKFHKIAFLVYFALNAFGFERPVEASCGLNHCPIRLKSEEPPVLSTGLFVSSEYHFVSFNISNSKGQYNLLNLSSRYDGNRFSLGATLPIAVLSLQNLTKTGLGNSLIFGEYTLLNTSHRLAVGSQLELPTGNHDDGFAASHFMIVPYMSYTHSFKNLYLAAQNGFMLGLAEGEHDHSQTTSLYVNPHENQEILYRVLMGYKFGNYLPEIYVSGHQVVDAHASGDKSFLAIGTNQKYNISQGSQIGLNAEIPVLSSAREYFKLGARADIRF